MLCCPPCPEHCPALPRPPPAAWRPASCLGAKMKAAAVSRPLPTRAWAARPLPARAVQHKAAHRTAVVAAAAGERDARGAGPSSSLQPPAGSQVRPDSSGTIAHQGHQGSCGAAGGALGAADDSRLATARRPTRHYPPLPAAPIASLRASVLAHPRRAAAAAAATPAAAAYAAAAGRRATQTSGRCWSWRLMPSWRSCTPCCTAASSSRPSSRRWRQRRCRRRCRRRAAGVSM